MQKYTWKHVKLLVIMSKKINEKCKNYFEIEKLEKYIMF